MGRSVRAAAARNGLVGRGRARRARFARQETAAVSAARSKGALLGFYCTVLFSATVRKKLLVAGIALAWDLTGSFSTGQLQASAD
jgi:hypothetical protein